ncbi:hypothetical protein [Mycobacteroides abscessus]|uniref:hypothetical protein n=1 Tax=Mycobacteroides abscessus TaxID=36809 RepID=UPI001390158E|nr:hypothetical protein [Mycobacteroides abscessus]
MTDDVTVDNKALWFAPVFYSLTVMGGLVSSFLGFNILEAGSAPPGPTPRGGGLVTCTLY